MSTPINTTTVARGGYFSGADLLLSDARVTLLLLREARDQTCARVFGVSRRDAGLVTIIVLATLADAADRKLHRVLKAIRPCSGDAVIAEGVLRECFHQIAGPASRQTPVIGSLFFATLLLRPVLRLSLRDLRVVGHQLRVDFDHRYGHLVRPNREGSIQGGVDHRIAHIRHVALAAMRRRSPQDVRVAGDGLAAAAAIGDRG